MKKIIYAILTTMLLATGCSESWLDPDPLSFYSPGNTLIDKEGMLSSVTAATVYLGKEFCRTTFSHTDRYDLFRAMRFGND